MSLQIGKADFQFSKDFLKNMIPSLQRRQGAKTQRRKRFVTLCLPGTARQGRCCAFVAGFQTLS
jgi:hypothetical protein